MKKSYDMTGSTQNPFARRLKRQLTIRVDNFSLSYFKDMAATSGLSYQTLINLYLRDCVSSRRKINLKWARRSA